jgi:hypothetical protein
MGLWYLIEKATGQDVNLTLEEKDDGRIFYSLNILSPVDNFAKETRVRELITAGAGQRETHRLTGISRRFIRKIQLGGSACAIHPLRKESAEVKKIIDLPQYNGWFYDLETSSGEFHCGVGKIHVHNSPRRGETFVTRKITRGVARILAGLDKKIYLGNLDARRDWGYAPEYVEAMYLILQQPEAEDFVIGTGESHSVREFAEEAFRLAGFELEWQGRGTEEKGLDRKTGKILIGIDPRYYRPSEVENLVADASKAREKLGWQPKKRFEDIVKLMLKHDLEQHNLHDYADRIRLS